MQIPTIGHREFSILSVLLDGGLRSMNDLREVLQVQWMSRASLTKNCTRLVRGGLIERRDALGRRRGRPCRIAVLSITPDGRQAWRETADFYSFLLGEFQSPPPSERFLSVGEVRGAAARLRRLPTPAEARRIARHATPAELLFWRILQQTQELRQAEICALSVPDVDPQARTVHVRGSRRRSLTAGPGLLNLLLQAIGERSAGLVLLREDGSAWTPRRFRRRWMLLRQKAGVPQIVVPRKSPTTKGLDYTQSR